MSFNSREVVENGLKYALDINKIKEENLEALGMDEFAFIELEVHIQEKLGYFDNLKVGEKLAECITVDDLVKIVQKLYEGIASGEVKLAADVPEEDVLNESNYLGNYLD